MALTLVPRKIAAGLLAGLVVCAPVAGATREAAPAKTSAEKPAPKITYQGVDTRLLAGDLVRFRLALRGAPDDSYIVEYARCAAAQYALIRGFGYARHIRTEMDGSLSSWRADAAYIISRDPPPGNMTINARSTVSDCTARGIPTV